MNHSTPPATTATPPNPPADPQKVALHTGDAARVVSTLPDSSVDTLVTSPPYWRLRNCARGDQAQVGLEDTAEDYIHAMRKVFRAARRVLTSQATMWLNLGDSYSSNSDGYWCTDPGHQRQPRYRATTGVAHKNLLGMPWRVAFALQDDGWILRSAIIWHKTHTCPASARDRLSSRHEMIFLFVTQPDYYFDLDAIRVPYTGDRALSRRTHRGGTKPHTASGVWPRTPEQAGEGRNPGNVWTVAPEHRRTDHPAPWPVEIPLRCIAAGSPPGGHVLDPFSGTATTGIAARQLGRRYTGIDINPTYHHLAAKRLATQTQHSARRANDCPPRTHP